MVIGIDEVGRGCWAGPLLAAAVELGDVKIEGLRDSKKCSAKKREQLSAAIYKHAKQIGIGWVDASEVDELGLTAAVKLAMQRAVDQINLNDGDIIIDGNVNYLPHINGTRALIKADDSVLEVSAASIIAKVARDEWMIKSARQYPDYGFENHVGYGTRQHIEALKLHGVLPIHRMSYKPIQALVTL